MYDIVHDLDEDFATQLRGQIGNGITALDLLRDGDLTEAERATVARTGIHGLTTALETLRRLAREREDALHRLAVSQNQTLSDRLAARWG